MRCLALFALLSVAVAKPTPGFLSSGWDTHTLSLDHASALSLDHAPLIEHAPLIQAAPVVHAAPVIHAAPVVHAPVAIAKAATSYSSFQRVIHPVHKVVAQPVIHAAPVVHAAPIVHAAPVLSHAPIASYGHGW